MRNDEDEKEYDFIEVERTHGVYTVIGEENQSEEWAEYIVSCKSDDFGWPFCFVVRMHRAHQKPMEFKYISHGSRHINSDLKYRRHKNLVPSFVLALIPEKD
jgi:hypothetical protein